MVDLYNYWTSLTTASGTYRAATLVTQPVESGFLGTLYAGAVAGIPDALATLFTGMSGTTTYEVARSVLLANGYIVEGGRAYRLEFADSGVALAGSRIASALNRLPSGTAVSVDGHSLGGHLAMAFSRLFPGATVDATAINGLGFKMTDPNVANLFTQLGGGAGFDAGKIQNLYGIAGPEFAAMNNAVLQQPGGLEGIYIESGGFGTIGGHSATQMTDSLSIYNLLAKLDPVLDSSGAVGVQSVTDILKASSGVAARTLEFVVAAVGKLFGVSATAFTADEFDSVAGGRELLYAALTAIDATLKTSTHNLGTAEAPRYAFTVQSLAGITAAALEFAARENLAYRYALKELNPFAILGFDYKDHNQNGKLELYGPENGEGQLSEAWIRDRARLLERRLSVNTADREPGLNGYHHFDGATDTLRIVDLETGFRVEDVRAGGSMLDGTAYAIFGTDSADDDKSGMVGSGKADRLYGMNGDDGLDGGGGDETHSAMAFRNCVRGIAISNRGSMRNGCTGLASLNLLWVIPLLVILVVGSVVVFYEGRKAYWDYQVREMCAKDGGVTVNEVVILSPTEAESMPKSGGYIGVGPESLAGPHVPFFYRVKEVRFREWNPRVTREEKAIFRRSDGRVIATSVVYGRGGGDVPSFAFPSVFYCPDLIQEKKEIQSIFQIEGETK